MSQSAPVDTITDASYVSRLASERLIAKGVLKKPVSLKRHSGGGGLRDNKTVFVGKGAGGLVVIVSPREFPGIVAEECHKAAEMRSFLGELGAPILEPMDTGCIDGSTYAVLPYRRPLSQKRVLGRLELLRIQRHVCNWLVLIAQRHGAETDVSTYRGALSALALRAPSGGATAAHLTAAERHLRSGRFLPRSMPMHGDLWKANVLHGEPGSAPFTLIDWLGSARGGFPVFDLVRAAQTFCLTPKALYAQLELHRRALGCQLEDLPVYLLGALGHCAARLGEMSPAVFLAMADDCVIRLSSALDAAALSARTARLTSGHHGHAPA